jgi:transcriptional regulator with AAA-type ATPase domain
VILLGRPGHYPKKLREQIESELGDGSKIIGRFEPVSHDPDSRDYRVILDRYSGVSICTDKLNADFGIIRKVLGRYRRRTFVFAYGLTSLGTLAAAQLLIDIDHNEVLASHGLPSFLQHYGAAEILLRAEQLVSQEVPWADELNPTAIHLLAEPVPPASVETAQVFEQLIQAKPEEVVCGLYQRQAGTANEGVCEFEVVGLHPSTSEVFALANGSNTDECVAWQLVGGNTIAKVVESLRAHAQSDEPTPILLVGSTGVGKELAARIVFQERVIHLLTRLAKDSNPVPLPAVVGARFVAQNCAGIMESLWEALLFGNLADIGTNVGAHLGAILGAGEGVVLLDDIEAMPMPMQAKLLRALQPPYQVTTVGSVTPVPYSALIIASTNEEPDTLVSANRMRPDLLARFRSGIVRIPSLAQRPADVPAILARVAGEPVLLDEQVLRCLLAAQHPINVRGLFQVVANARRSLHGRMESAVGSALRIQLEDLEESSRPLAHFIHRVLSFRQSDDSAKLFRFTAPVASPVLEDVFDQAALILSSIDTSSSNPALRQVDPDFNRILGDPKAEPQGQDVLRLAFKNVNEAADRWIRTAERLDHFTKKPVHNMSLLAQMYRARIHPEGGQAGTGFGKLVTNRCNQPRFKGRISKAVLASSLGEAAQTLSGSQIQPAPD